MTEQKGAKTMAERKKAANTKPMGASGTVGAESLEADFHAHRGEGASASSEPCCCAANHDTCRHKAQPRGEAAKRQLDNRLNRIIGQLNGVKAMVAEDRYCGDVLIQLAAAQSALQSVGYQILKEHMNSCVAAQVRAGEPQAMDELLGLVKKLK